MQPKLSCCSTSSSLSLAVLWEASIFNTVKLLIYCLLKQIEPAHCPLFKMAIAIDGQIQISVLLEVLVALLLVICFAYFGASCPLLYSLSPFSCRTLATTERDGYCSMHCAPKVLHKMICFAHSHVHGQCSNNNPHIDIFTSRFCSHRMFWTEPPWTCIKSMLVKHGDSYWLQ